MQELIVNINGKEYTAGIRKGNPNIYINDKPYQVELMRQLASNVYSFSVNNRICQIELTQHEYGKSQILMDGFVYDIEITDETKKLLNQYILQTGSGHDTGAGFIKAPMPGLVIKISVSEGQLVEKGDKVIIVEAMKMENVLQSPVGGIVKSIKVREGQAVEKDAVLLEIVDSL